MYTEYISTQFLAIMFYLVYYKKHSLVLFRTTANNFQKWLKTSNYKNEIKIKKIEYNDLFKEQFGGMYDLPKYTKQEMKCVGSYVSTSSPKRLLELLNEYLELFREDKLITCNRNIPRFKKQIEFIKGWQGTYADIADNFLMSPYWTDRNDTEWTIGNQRIPELIFLTVKDKFAEVIAPIELYKYPTTDIWNILFKIKFLKPPEEIYEIYNSHVMHKNIRVNKKSGIVYHKEKKIQFRPKTKAFKLLCYLLDNLNKEIDIKQVIKDLKLPEKQDTRYTLDSIRALTKDIKNKFATTILFTINVSKHSICMTLK